MSTDLDKLLSKHEETTNQYLKVFEEELGCKFEILSKVNDRLVMILTRDTEIPSIINFVEPGRHALELCSDYILYGGCKVLYFNHLYIDELRFALKIVQPYFLNANHVSITYQDDCKNVNRDCLRIFTNFEGGSLVQNYDFRKGDFEGSDSLRGRKTIYTAYKFDVEKFKKTGEIERIV